MTTTERRIILCADDYGISPGVNTAIRNLVAQGRINATSAMVVAPSLNRAEAVALSLLNAGERRVAIGLHVTLTAPFKPLTEGFWPLVDGAFFPVNKALVSTSLRRFNANALAREIAAQLAAFIECFGRPPDFVDGHQHVQIFPQVRDAFLEAVKTVAPNAWVRQCGRAAPLHRRFKDSKAMILDVLSLEFRRRAQSARLATNAAFAGTYDFVPQADFAVLFPRFLDALPDGGLVMCHPGFVDDELRGLDPLTDLREREYAYFSGPDFPEILAKAGVALAAP
jgi:chitin disaccharide deacetylase